jgi:hypothetical protein
LETKPSTWRAPGVSANRFAPSPSEFARPATPPFNVHLQPGRHWRDDAEESFLKLSHLKNGHPYRYTGHANISRVSPLRILHPSSFILHPSSCNQPSPRHRERHNAMHFVHQLTTSSPSISQSIDIPVQHYYGIKNANDGAPLDTRQKLDHGTSRFPTNAAAQQVSDKNNDVPPPPARNKSFGSGAHNIPSPVTSNTNQGFPLPAPCSLLPAPCSLLAPKLQPPLRVKLTATCVAVC